MLVINLMKLIKWFVWFLSIQSTLLEGDSDLKIADVNEVIVFVFL